MFKTVLTSTRNYAIFVAASALAGFFFTDSFDRLLFGGASFPAGTLSRLITAMFAGIFATFASLALYALSAFTREGSFDHSQTPTPQPTAPRGTEGGGESHGADLSYSAGMTERASPLAEGAAGDFLSVGGDAGASEMCADGSSGVGGDYGGSESGGDSGGGDFGGGGGGGSWS